MPLLTYDSNRFGPLFAVSDEGSAGPAIVEAAYASAKARAITQIDPITLGVALDGERMTSAGEVPIGPEEYEALSSVAAGRLLCTTNVGVRVNLRLGQQLPEFAVTEKTQADPQWFEAVLASFSPFIQTPDNHPRPLTVRLLIEPNESAERLKTLGAKIDKARLEGKLGPASLHQFTLLLCFDREITDEEDIQTIERALKLAAETGFKEVAIDGQLRKDARLRLSLQSLLNVLPVKSLRRLLKAADSLGVRLAYRHQADIESAARTIWTGLHTARTHGFAAGKYGLVPLTLEEQSQAIGMITRWMSGWTAIPAFYVDTPLVTAKDVFDDSQCEEAARLWLKMARGAGVTVVLFDSPDRVTPRKLLRQPNMADDTGVLTIEAVERILAFAKELGVSVLWSGGITSRQAFELAKRKVFGIFSTSSTAKKIAVTAQFEGDPRLAAENEPTEFGVRRIHAIIQGGFLNAALAASDKTLAETISEGVGRLLDSEKDATRSAVEIKNLDANLIRGWSLLNSSRPNDSLEPLFSTNPSIMPVPADAVRVFRGRINSKISRELFHTTLAATFMPITVQMQRLFGLTAYLPAVLPADQGHGLPDEVALVFYRTQEAYHEAKRCVGGRAYSELHKLVFDMPNSGSGFPELFSGTITFDHPYHLLIRSVDWQTGHARLYVGTRKVEAPSEALRLHVLKIAAELQRAPGTLDAVIFCLNKEWLIWWEHSPDMIKRDFGFSEVTEKVFSAAPRCLRVPLALTRPYNGISLEGRGDFINLRFEPV